MARTLLATQEDAFKQQALVFSVSFVSDTRLKAFWPMLPTLARPKFSKEQRVCFIGGVGAITSCRAESGTWTYTIDMDMGAEPDLGRVGSETTILLQEAEIHKVVWS